MELEYKCIVADHDDTAVNSSKFIHHPIYLELLSTIRPSSKPLSVEEFIEINRKIGLRRHYEEDLGFSQEEWKYAYNLWLTHPLRLNIPKFYVGFLDVISEFKFEGSIYTIVSHSNEEAIRAHYEHAMNGNRSEFISMVFGSSPETTEHNKPHPWPLDRIMETYQLNPKDIVVIDDLEPGIEMAEKRNVDTIGVGWSHYNPDTFKKRCTFYAENVENLRDILFRK